MTAPTFIIYGLFDPRSGELRYVGKSERGVARFKSHLQPSTLKVKTRRSGWIKGLLARGLKPVGAIIQSFEARDSLAEAEVYWIAHFRAAGCRLTNATAGGEGVVSPTAEVREKLRAAAAGRKASPALRARLSQAHIGQERTEETRRKISDGLTGRKKSAATVAAMSAARSAWWARRRAA